MAVDLGDLIENVQAAVNPPGTNLFPDAVDDDWILRLQNGFWQAVLDGLITGFTESDSLVTPVSGSTDISRDLQQVVVLYAAMDTVLNEIRNLGVSTRAKAGPVEFESQRSATTLRDILKELQIRRNLLLQRLGDLGVTDTYYIDAVIARDEAYLDGITSWVSLREGIA